MLLGVNFYGLLLCTALFLVPWAYERVAQAKFARRLAAVRETRR
jgi:hypothetical protein